MNFLIIVENYLYTFSYNSSDLQNQIYYLHYTYNDILGRFISSKQEIDVGQKEFWLLSNYLKSEKTYLDLVNEHKLKAQEAREVLPLGTKTMLMHCAFKSDWLDFIKLRKSPAAHPDAYKLAAEVEKLLNNKI